MRDELRYLRQESDEVKDREAAMIAMADELMALVDGPHNPETERRT
jgi:hypothetical protein